MESKLQEISWRHIGHEYNQSWHDDGSTTITDGQEFYSKTIQPVAIPSGSRTRLLVEEERSDLRHINGEMSYAKETRPDAMGRIAYSQQNVDKDACVQHLIEANKALEVLHDPEVTKVLTYAPLDERYLKLVGIADGALRKKSEKYSQGCFYVLIQEVLEGDIWGSLLDRGVPREAGYPRFQQQHERRGSDPRALFGGHAEDLGLVARDLLRRRTSAGSARR